MNVQRQSLFYFIIRTKDMAWSLVALIPLYNIWNNQMNNPLFLLGVVGLVITITLGRLVLGYFNTTYSVVGDDVHVHYGILDVSTINISTNPGIINYRVTDSWMHKIFGVEGLEINFRNGEDQPPIKFAALSTEQIDLLTKHVNVANDNEETMDEIEQYEVPEVDVVWNKIVLTGLFSANYVLIIPIVLQGIEYIEPVQKYLPVHLEIVPLTILAILIMPLFTIALQFMRYSEFKIYDLGTRFVVKNGVIDSDQHIIEKENINGVLVEQSLGMRLLGLCTVSAVMNDADSEDGTQTKNTLFPYLKLNQVDELLLGHLPMYADKFEHIGLRMTVSKVIYLMFISLFVLVGVFYFGLSIWTYIGALIVFGLLSTPTITTIQHTVFGVLIRTGFLNLKTYILPSEKLGVTAKTTFVRLFKVEHVYTDLTPSYHFKQLD